MPGLSTIRALGAALVLSFIGCGVAGAGPQAQTTAPQPFAVQPGFDGLRMMPGKPGYATTPLGEIHYWSLGSGPALLLLHQGPMFGVEFAKVMPLLAAQGFRAIAIDIPGFGLSERPDHVPSADEYADSFAVLLDRLGIKTASLAGNHTGATLALAFAARHPDRTACLVTHGLPIYSPEELAQRVAKPPVDTRIYADGRQIGETWHHIVHDFHYENNSPEAIQWLMIGWLLAGDMTWYVGAPSRAFDAPDAIKRVKAPTLIISNTTDAIHSSAARALKLRPDFAYKEFQGGTSLMIYDDPVTWADTVGGFIHQNCPAG